jgi:hypothetical protein
MSYYLLGSKVLAETPCTCSFSKNIMGNLRLWRDLLADYFSEKIEQEYFISTHEFLLIAY